MDSKVNSFLVFFANLIFLTSFFSRYKDYVGNDDDSDDYDSDDAEDLDGDFLEDALLDAGYDGEADA